MKKKIQKKITDSLALSKAHYNTYRIVTGKISMLEMSEEDEFMILICDPFDLRKWRTCKPIVQELIDFYLPLQDYKKCAELRELIKNYEK